MEGWKEYFETERKMRDVRVQDKVIDPDPTIRQAAMIAAFILKWEDEHPGETLTYHGSTTVGTLQHAELMEAGRKELARRAAK